MYYQTILIEKKGDFNLADLLPIIGVQGIKNYDVRTIEKSETKQSIGIEEVSQINEWNYLKNENLNIFQINDADRLTPEAQNSLLKVLEEPGENKLIVLVTKNSNSLLDTIRSRAQIVRINSIEGENDHSRLLTNPQDFLKATFSEREKIASELIDSEGGREAIANFLESLISELIEASKADPKSTKHLNMIELLRLLSIANRNSVNTKLIFDTLNSSLEIFN